MQRLSWVRIFVLDPEIIMLDEATASLDGITADAIKRIADKAFKGRTVIMISCDFRFIIWIRRSGILIIETGM